MERQKRGYRGYRDTRNLGIKTNAGMLAYWGNLGFKD